MLRGDETELLNALINCGGFDAVVHGHSHAGVSSRSGKSIIVNPEEVCGYLTSKPTIALLDTAKKETKIVELDL